MKSSSSSLYSVIIPTMWAPGVEFVSDLIGDLKKSKHVGEIILIDNSPGQRRPWSLRSSRKLKILPQKRNLFVNPSWNLGVATATHDRIAIINDDINADWSIFEVADQFLASSFSLPKITPGAPKTLAGDIPIKPRRGESSIGLIGLDSGGESSSHQLAFRAVHERPVGFGQLMMMNRHSFREIPPELLVWSGDTFLFESCLQRSQTNIALSGWPIRHAEGKSSMTSSGKEFELLKKEDVKFYWRNRGRLLVAAN